MLPYVVSNAQGEKARFADDQDAIEFAKNKSKADKGAFTWYVRQERCTQPVMQEFWNGKVI